MKGTRSILRPGEGSQVEQEENPHGRSCLEAGGGGVRREAGREGEPGELPAC